jgi:hypothetical protein
LREKPDATVVLSGTTRVARRLLEPASVSGVLAAAPAVVRRRNSVDLITLNIKRSAFRGEAKQSSIQANSLALVYGNHPVAANRRGTRPCSVANT